MKVVLLPHDPVVRLMTVQQDMSHVSVALDVSGLLQEQTSMLEPLDILIKATGRAIFVAVKALCLAREYCVTGSVPFELVVQCSEAEETSSVAVVFDVRAQPLCDTWNHPSAELDRVVDVRYSSTPEAVAAAVADALRASGVQLCADRRPTMAIRMCHPWPLRPI